MRALLLLAIIVNATAVGIGNIMLLVIGSVTRPELHHAQMRSFGSEFRERILVVEDDAECVLCSDGGDFERSDLFSDGTLPFSGRSDGYYCSLSRNLQGLRLALRSEAGQRARWVLMIDDDTFVNVRSLLHMLSARDDERDPIVIGSAWGGGAGYAFSRAALDALLTPVTREHCMWNASTAAWMRKANTDTVLDACISAQLGGTLCNSPADWAIKRCVDAAGAMLHPQPDAMQQDCQWAEAMPAPSPEWMRAMVTCHHVESKTMMALARHAYRYSAL